MKKISGLLLICSVFFCSGICHAQDSAALNMIESVKDVESDQVYDFAKAYVDSLIDFKVSLKKLQAPAEFEGSMVEIAERINDLNNSNMRVSKAAEWLKPYETSEVQGFSWVAVNANHIYSKIQGLNLSIIRLLTQALNGEVTVEEVLPKVSEMMVIKNGTYEALVYISLTATYFLVDYGLIEKGTPGYSRLTSDQRKSLIEALDKTFGDGIKEYKTGVNYTDAGAAAVRDVLAGDFKSADEKQMEKAMP